MLLTAPHAKLAFAAAAITATFLALTVLPRVPEKGAGVNISFIGNSIIFVNDLPRFFSALSGERIQENSCLHGSLNLASILLYGNGMYFRWSSENARVPAGRGEDDSGSSRSSMTYRDENGESSIVYDFGACTVQQLLFGEDDKLSSSAAQEGDDVDDGDAYYADDGKNPCLVDQNYLQYLQHAYPSRPHWDYVVMNDNTGYPGDYYLRQSTMQVLEEVYVDMFLSAGCTPVFLMTYGYIKTAQDASYVTLGNVSVFTSRVYYGYQMYAQTLAASLAPEQQPILAPVGLAFLVIYEENHGMWKKLFYYDGFHPSPHGTYLIGCVVYASIFARMPPTDLALAEDFVRLWSRARQMQLETSDEYPAMPFPTLAEANYLSRVCKRVVLQGYQPTTLLNNEQVEALESMEYGLY